jgi:hypothetical protein
LKSMINWSKKTPLYLCMYRFNTAPTTLWTNHTHPKEVALPLQDDTSQLLLYKFASTVSEMALPRMTISSIYMLPQTVPRHKACYQLWGLQLSSWRMRMDTLYTYPKSSAKVGVV